MCALNDDYRIWLATYYIINHKVSPGTLCACTINTKCAEVSKLDDARSGRDDETHELNTL